MKKTRSELMRNAGILVLSVTAVWSTALAQTEKDTDKDGIPDSAEIILKTDPMNPDTDGDGINDFKDQKPLNADAVFSKTSGQKDFSINRILVEDNYDPVAKKDAPDHLEIKLKNSSSKDIREIVVFYRITDLSTKQQESYIVPLSELVLKKGQTRTVHIDLVPGTDHYRANPNSLYYTSINKRKVDVIISAPGHLAQEKSVIKDAGGAEIPD